MVYKIEFYYGYYWTTHMLISEKRLFFYIGPNFAIEQQKFEVKGPVLVNYMHFYCKADKYSNVFEKCNTYNNVQIYIPTYAVAN